MRKMKRMALASVLGAVVLVGCSMGVKDKEEQEPQFPASVTAETDIKDPHPPVTTEPTTPQTNPDTEEPTELWRLVNNRHDCERWGDEVDFFRGTKLATEVDELQSGDLFVGQSKVGELTIDDNGSYALLIHCHNGTGEPLKNVAISVSYPMTISGDSEAHVSIDAEQLGASLTASLALRTELSEVEISGGRVRIGSDNKEVECDTNGYVIGDRIIDLITLEIVPEDADYTFFILFETSQNVA